MKKLGFLITMLVFTSLPMGKEVKTSMVIKNPNFFIRF